MQATPEDRSHLLREPLLSLPSASAHMLDMLRVPGICLQEVNDQLYLGLRSATHDFNTEELPPTRRRHHAIYTPIRTLVQSSALCMSSTVFGMCHKILFSLDWQPGCRLSMLEHHVSGLLSFMLPGLGDGLPPGVPRRVQTSALRLPDRSRPTALAWRVWTASHCCDIPGVVCRPPSAGTVHSLPSDVCAGHVWPPLLLSQQKVPL